MTQTIRTIKKKAIPVLRRAGVRRAGIFGSVVRGEARKRSDIDMLIQPPQGKFSLFDLIHLENDLERVLGRKVDLGTYNMVHPYLKERILGEAVTIYEKRKRSRVVPRRHR